MKKIAIIVLSSILLFPSLSIAKGSVSVGRSSGSIRSSSVSAKVSTQRPISTPKPAVITKPVVKPTVVKSTQQIKSSNGKKMSTSGKVIDSNYQPKFVGGYTAPIGSVVYYRESSVLDYLPLYLILTSNSHRDAVVVTPQSTSTDGRIIPSTTTTVKEDGIDTMYVINWIVTILFFGGIIALALWFINKKTLKNK